MNALMELAETKLLELTKHGYALTNASASLPVFFLAADMCDFSEMLDEYGVRLNVLGRIEMLPENVQNSVRIAQEMTKNNDKYVGSDPFFAPPALTVNFVQGPS